MQMTVAQLAALLGGTVDGDAARVVSTIAKIEEAGPQAVAFLANPKYEEYLYTTQAGAVLVRQDLVLSQPVQTTLVRLADPYSAFTALLEQVERMQQQALQGREEPSYLSSGVELPADAYLGAFAYIGKGVKLGAGVKIYPQAYVGDGCTIGPGTILYAGARLYAGTQVGARCIIHSGAVVGSDGFGHAPQPDGSYRKIPQLGTVILEDDVEVGANTTIDRATMGITRIGRGTKMDNLIQIGHNSDLGEHVVVAAQAGVAGSTKVGPYCQIGGQAGLAGHLTIAAGTKFAAQSGVMASILTENTIQMGAPCYEYKAYLKSYAAFRRLPELEKVVREIKMQS